MRKRLSSEIAEKLGFKIKPNKGIGNPKYYLNKEKLKEYNIITNIDNLIKKKIWDLAQSSRIISNPISSTLDR